MTNVKIKFLSIFLFLFLYPLFSINSDRLGVLVTEIYPDTTRERIENVLNSVKEIGAKWIRVGIIWSLVNPEKGKFNFGNYDFLINEATKRGISPLVTVIFTPQWTSSSPNSYDYYLYPPTENKIGDFQSPFGTDGTGYDYLYQFAFLISNRYKGKVKYWELWNEPDMNGFLKDPNGDGTTSDEYSKMLAYFYRGIKDGNGNARILLGGLADSPSEPGCEIDYLLKLLTDPIFPAYENFDIHNIHTNFRTPEEIVAQISRNRDTFRSSGFNPKKIWITETSYTPVERFQNLNGYKNGEKGFNNYIEDALKLELSSCDGKVFWAKLFDDSDNTPEDDPYKYSGLFTSRLKLKNGGKFFKKVSREKLFNIFVPILKNGNNISILNESGFSKPILLEKFSDGKILERRSYYLEGLKSFNLRIDGKSCDFILVRGIDNSIDVYLKQSGKEILVGNALSKVWELPLKTALFNQNCKFKLLNQMPSPLKLKIEVFGYGKVISTLYEEIPPLNCISENILKKLGINPFMSDFLKIEANFKIPSPIITSDNFLIKMFPISESGIESEKATFLENEFSYIPCFSENFSDINFISLNHTEKNKYVKIKFQGAEKSIEIYGNSSLIFSLTNPEQISEIIAQRGIDIFQIFKLNERRFIFKLSPKLLKRFILDLNQGELPQKKIFLKNPHKDLNVKVSVIFEGNGNVLCEKNITLGKNSSKIVDLSNLSKMCDLNNVDRVIILSNFSMLTPLLMDSERVIQFSHFKLNRYPELFSYYLPFYINNSDVVTPLSKRDLVVIDMENQRVCPEIVKKIRKLNGEAKILAYMTSEEISTDTWELQDSFLRKNLYDMIKPQWWLLDASGEHIVFWPGTYMLNCSDLCTEINGLKWGDIFAYFTSYYVMASGLWDGFYIDNCWDDVSWVADCIDIDNDGICDSGEKLDYHWHLGMEEILSQMRNYSPGYLLMGNGGYTYGKYLNGALIEEFTKWSSWYNEMNIYLNMEKNHRRPFIGSINGEGGEENYQRMRFFLTSTLMGDGYFSYDNGDQYHDSNWWYDEYNHDLGVPIQKAELILGSPSLSENFENFSWSLDNDVSNIISNGIDGKSIEGDSTNSPYQWNEFLFSPEGYLRSGEEVIIQFDYKILEKSENTKFYYIFRSASDSGNYDLDRGNFFGDNAGVGEYKTYNLEVTLGNASDYYLLFGIKNRGKIVIDNIRVYGDEKVIMMRRFERGIAICNASSGWAYIKLDKNYKKIEGTQDPDTNNGETVNSVTLKPKDGIILLNVESDWKFSSKQKSK